MVQMLACRVSSRQDIGRIVTKSEAGVCQGHVLAGAIEEPDSERVLKRFDLECESRLTQKESARSFSVVQRVRKDDETLQLSESEIQMQLLGRRSNGDGSSCAFDLE
jgi:hypothetical protein